MSDFLHCALAALSVAGLIGVFCIIARGEAASADEDVEELVQVRKEDSSFPFRHLGVFPGNVRERRPFSLDFLFEHVVGKALHQFCICAIPHVED